MIKKTIAVIGTAGRRDDGHYLTLDHYKRMVSAVKNIVNLKKIAYEELNLVSGGAAWADHVTVTLALENFCNPSKVTLFLPTLFENNLFIDKNDLNNKTASTANYYHHQFKQKTGIESLLEISMLQEKGGELIPGNSNFFIRNKHVAESLTEDDLLIAFTFGSEDESQPPWSIRLFSKDIKAQKAGLKDGGTAHTWNASKCFKYHARLGKTL